MPLNHAHDDEAIDALLRGAVDLHCHSGPSVMGRKINHAEEIADAAAAGMRAILIKDHFYSATPVLELVKRHRPAGSRLEILSGVPLNNALGGLNPRAVEVGLNMGARLVWMPTLSASNHLRTAHYYNLAGRLGMLPVEGLSVLSANGTLRDEVKEILDLIAEHDAVLCGGHLHVSEMYPLFAEARKRGVTRMLVSHPTFWIDANPADLRELASMDVHLEHCACMLIDCPSRQFTAEELHDYVTAGGLAHTILGSDLGQPMNPRPVEGFRSVIKLCLDSGFTPDETRQMTSSNAVSLMGLSSCAD
ncbi:DUF6282 family protein [Neorhizobium sp. DT-125]|uniref:DUF6282 family protein n=1 Tax=Neorhizobium sp. DT-125 TaxID=3396163 RepID=UPI003F1985C0